MQASVTTSRRGPRNRPPGGVETSRWPLILAAIGIVAAVFLAYLPAMRAGFIWDDDDYILLNRTLREPGGLGEIWSPSSPLNPQYYPMVFTTFRLENSLWGLDPTGYHAVNVVLHALNALLLLLVLRRIGVAGAWLVAAIFAVHPVMVESVAWITERKNVLSLFFSLLATLAWLRFDDRGGKRWIAVAFICFVLALASKTVAAVLPIALCLISYWREKRLDALRWATLTAMLGVGIRAAMITKSHEAAHVLTGGTELDWLSFGDRLQFAGRAFWFYPWKLAWPASLAFIYSRWNPATWQWVFPIAAIGLGIALVYLHVRGRVGRGPVVAVAYYAVTIFPALGFVNVAPLRFSWVADHFQYQASIGWIALAVGGAAWLFARLGASKVSTVVAGAVGIGIVAILALRSHDQAGVYRDLGTLWADTVEKTPGSAMAQINYGQWLFDHQDFDGAERCFQTVIRVSPPPSEAAVQGFTNLAAIRARRGPYDEAISFAQRALDLHPGFPPAVIGLSQALVKVGRAAEAEAALRALLADAPDPALGRAAWDIRRRTDDADVYLTLGNAQDAQGHVSEAAESFRRAVAINPNKAEPYLNLGNECLKLDRFDEAVSSYRRAIELKPQYAKAHFNLTKALAGAKRYDDAIAAARRSVQSVSDDPSFPLELAWLLLTSPDASDRNATEAATWLERVRASTQTQNPRAMEVLAAAQAEAGRFAQAAQSIRRAIELVQPQGNSVWLDHLRQENAAYERNQPWREPSE
ncbi:MAG: tetratricopeptide repeat protein [Planctomycetes bacterium]|nr:tetratricopeptide repeat protein [Planctomycetota bacterium]